jgi:hypothetical protein
MKTAILLVDKAFNADQRVVKPSRGRRQDRHHSAKSNPKTPLPFDGVICKARHLIENFCCSPERFHTHCNPIRQDRPQFLTSIHLVVVAWLD